jgi:hypothetical protein
MAEEQFKIEDNPWLEVAKMYIPSKIDCLYGENNYFCEGDRIAIGNYNKKASGTDEIITKIPAEPWWGNPLKARLIILSLNPGYVPEVNKTLALLMQSNDAIRFQTIAYKAKTLRLAVDSFLPIKEDDVVDAPVSCRDCVNMLGDWYWVKMLRQLQEDVEKKAPMIDEEEFYKQVALIEYCGYSSETAKLSLPKSEEGSYGFLKKLLSHISKKEDIQFLIMRDANHWDKLLRTVECSTDKILYRKSKSRSQYITPGNFEKDVYKSIVEFLARKKI